MPKIHYNVEDTYLAKPEGFRETKDLKEQKREKNNIKNITKYYARAWFGHDRPTPTPKKRNIDVVISDTSNP